MVPELRLSGVMLLLSLLGHGAQAQVYSWVDENGVMYFSDRPRPVVGHTQVKPVVTPRPDNGAVAPAQSSRRAESGPSPLKPVSVNIDVQNSVQFYPVHGQTAFDVHRYIEQFGPADENGARAAGKGIYAFDWRVTPKATADRCAVGDVEVAVSIRQIMPKWSELADAEVHWQLWWQSYLDQMSRYEQRQQDLMQLGAEQIAARLKQLESTGDCQALQARVAREGLHELSQLRRRSARLATIGDNP